MAEPELMTVQGLEITPYYSIKPSFPTQLELGKIRSMGNMFTAFGNHEAKALTLLALGIEDDVTKHQLRSTLTKFTGNVWDLHADSVENYCRTFRKFGGFTEAEQPPRGLERWELTKTGIETLPVAAYILLESYRYSIPLTLAFGSSTSPNDQHAPANSLLILADMASRKDRTTIATVVKNTDIKYTTTNSNILRLARLGFIDHESLTPEYGKGTIKYSVKRDVPEQEIPNIKGKASYLVKAIYTIMKRANSPLSVDDIVSIVQNGQSFDPRLCRLKNFRKVVNNVLGSLSRLGLLQSNLTAVTDQSPDLGHLD